MGALVVLITLWKRIIFHDADIYVLRWHQCEIKSLPKTDRLRTTCSGIRHPEIEQLTKNKESLKIKNPASGIMHNKSSELIMLFESQEPGIWPPESSELSKLNSPYRLNSLYNESGNS